MQMHLESQQYLLYSYRLILKRRGWFYWVYAFYNAILTIIAAWLLVFSNSLYWIAILLTGIMLFSAIITYFYMQKTILYRSFIYIIVVMGSLAAISLWNPIGGVLLVINIFYLCGIAVGDRPLKINGTAGLLYEPEE